VDISTRTTGELIDILITTNIKCFLAQDRIMNESLSRDERMEAAIMAQQMNAKRTSIMAALNKRLDNDEIAVTTKTYDK
jgi:hypothetical protein